ncbi:hypothetical protein LXL04_002885 [Taraxacum kok-saghyz]
MKKGAKRKAAAASCKDELASTSTEPAAAATTTTEAPEEQHNKEHIKVGRPTKRSKVPKPESEPEYFEDQRELEDLWKQVFPVGTEVCATATPYMLTSSVSIHSVGYSLGFTSTFLLQWDQLDLLSEYKWNFSNLENAFDEGGVLHGKKVYLFSCTERNTTAFFGGQSKVTCVPVVVAIVSPFPPSDKIGINSVQRESEEILDMKQMKMDWVPYIPYGKR